MKEKNQRNLHETEILEASGLEEQTESSGYFELERKNRKDKPQTVVYYSKDKGLIENEFKQSLEGVSELIEDEDNDLNNNEENCGNEAQYPYISSEEPSIKTISATNMTAGLPYDTKSSSLETSTTVNTTSTGTFVANSSFSRFLADVGVLGIIAVGVCVFRYAIYKIRARNQIQKKVNSLAGQLNARDKQGKERNKETCCTLIEETPTKSFKNSKKEVKKEKTTPIKEIKLKEVKSLIETGEPSVSKEFKSPPKPPREIRKIRNPDKTSPQLTQVQNKLDRTKSLDMETPCSAVAKRRSVLRRSKSNIADYSMPAPMERIENKTTEDMLESDFQGMETCSVRISPVIEENIPFRQLKRSSISDQAKSIESNEAQVLAEVYPAQDSQVADIQITTITFDSSSSSAANEFPETAMRSRTMELFRELNRPLDTSTESSGAVVRRTHSQIDLPNLNPFKLN